MPYLDRDSFLALLEQLGSSDDQEVIDAARQLDRRVRDAGVTWDELLTPEGDGDDGYDDDEDDDADADGEYEDEYGEEVGDGEIEEAEFDAEEQAPPPGRGKAVAAGDDEALIDRMLGEFDLSDQTRQDLLDLKEDIAAGEFTEMDRRYLDALYARLTNQS